VQCELNNGKREKSLHVKCVALLSFLMQNFMHKIVEIDPWFEAVTRYVFWLEDERIK
jgi:hypothetical protein